MDIELEPSQFWTDSTIVLQYIFNQERRFHTFVANRVAEIQGKTEVEQWHHVPTKDNPANIENDLMFHVHFHYSLFVKLLFFIEGEYMSDIGLFVGIILTARV